MLGKLFQGVVEWFTNPSIKLKAVYPWGAATMGKTYFFSTMWFYIGSFAPLLAWLVPLLYGYFFDLRLLLAVMDFSTDNQGVPREGFLVLMMVSTFVTGFAAQMLYLNGVLRRDGMSLFSVMAIDTTALYGQTWYRKLWSFVWPVALAYGLCEGFSRIIEYTWRAPEQHTVHFLRSLSHGNQVVFLLMAALAAPIVEEVVFRGFLFQGLRSVFRRLTWEKTKSQMVYIKNNFVTLPYKAKNLFMSLPWLGLQFLIMLLNVLLYVVTFRWVLDGFYFGVYLVTFKWARNLVERKRRFDAEAKAVNEDLRAASPTSFKLTMKERLADLTAMLVSSLLFWLLHMQFDAVTFILMMVLALVACELYRRTGSLLSCIALHCVNNAIAVITVMWLGG